MFQTPRGPTVLRSQVMFLAAILLAATVGSAQAADTRVTLEVIATSRFAINGAQQWARDLGEIGFTGVRIRIAKASESPRPELTGEPGDASRKVVGVLTADNRLVLPDGTYRRGDSAAIRAWLEQIEKNEPAPQPTAAFGLTAEQLVDLHTQLAIPVRTKTQGKQALAVAGTVVRPLALPISVSDAAKTRLAAAEPVRDELQGIATGTALTALLRPLGLGLAPQKDATGVRLVVDDFRKLPEAWPVGWPLQEKEAEVVPKLFEYLPVEINNTPLADTVAAIAGRLELPVLYDHNAMARHRIDPWRETSSLPEGRTYYRRILDRTLIPAGLKVEVRLDEAEQPFLWVSTVKP